ncbi:MAG TPA: SDR family oxidoreductase [Acidothermaceae bacterium]|nr:SDR family oxidoreductase [Acidothermaceae bacterium]
MSVIAVTGSTGMVGGAVARGLAAAGQPIRLVVRDDSRAPQLTGAEVATATYGDAAMQAALIGVQTLFLVSASEDANRVALHTATVDAAVAAGVERIVYTSFYGASADATFTFARDHWHTEQHIRGSGVSFVFLRDNLYLDGLVGFWIGPDGVLAGPAGDGRTGAVARDDVADVAVTVLLDPATHDGQTYDLTGPQAICLADVTEAVAAASGRAVRYQAETMEEAYASRAHFGRPRFEVDGWVSGYVAIANGELDAVTDTVPRLTGHPAAGLDDFLRVHPESYAHLL